MEISNVNGEKNKKGLTTFRVLIHEALILSKWSLCV